MKYKKIALITILFILVSFSNSIAISKVGINLNKKNFKLPQDVLFKYYWKLLLKFIYSKEKQPASHRN